ncbi:G-protein coupled receptor [Drechmeria coniospora]|uniref:G-protein coupled receptor n=1 Tax=Drechmeria coniospora TaxID=98403 RepID=A0A151GKL4_DRECN|nr:G-protein coupled receptor [Drechmeria coniospora]KYK57644.1 G-protein coupled receptor [Drechmeria coniospora]
MGGLTPGDILAITDIERICSVLSILGSMFIIITFSCSKSFHRPINRLVLYASFGNIMSNVGTLMSRSMIYRVDSFGCQFQAFLIQLFMPADALWTLAMAVNVYLTFYHKFDAERLRKMEKWYLLCCYGIPFVPAFTYIFYRNAQGERIYGNATLWCWIANQFDVLRIATFYAPIWIIMLVTMSIYASAGRTIFEKRKQLMEFNASTIIVDDQPMATFKKTEITISSDKDDRDDNEDNDQGSHSHIEHVQRTQSNISAYSVNISADRRRSCTTAELTIPAAVFQPPKMAQVPPSQGSSVRRYNYEVNNAAWSYTKCAILFFTAILVTWIPSSANRVYSLVHKNQVCVPLLYMSAFVLPLQGFWNAVIYTVTSWDACKSLFRRSITTSKPVDAGMTRLGSDQHERTPGMLEASSGFNFFNESPRISESESIQELGLARTRLGPGKFA